MLVYTPTYSGHAGQWIYNGYQNAGYHQLEFDGNGVSSGMYFIKISSDKFIKSQKLILVK